MRGGLSAGGGRLREEGVGGVAQGVGADGGEPALLRREVGDGGAGDVAVGGGQEERDQEGEERRGIESWGGLGDAGRLKGCP